MHNAQLTKIGPPQLMVSRVVAYAQCTRVPVPEIALAEFDEIV